MTPGEAIRAICVDCVGSVKAVRDCMGDTLVTGPCQFYKYRMGKGRPSVKTIRKHCLYCMNGDWRLIKSCHTVNCPLYSFRYGKNPNFISRKVGDSRRSEGIKQEIGIVSMA
jgi:hypothetical protein